MTENEARQKAVDQFTSWLGYNESDGTHKAIIDLYNTQASLPRGYTVKYTDEWCATTVSAVGVALGWTDIIFPECSCGYQVSGFQSIGRWVEADNYTPSAGDIIYYYWSDDGLSSAYYGLCSHLESVTSPAYFGVSDVIYLRSTNTVYISLPEIDTLEDFLVWVDTYQPHVVYSKYGGGLGTIEELDYAALPTNYRGTVITYDPDDGSVTSAAVEATVRTWQEVSDDG